MRFLDYLQQAGYTKYRGHVRASVYRFFACPHPEKGCWYVQRDKKSFQCTGCAWHCETDDDSGFQPLLPFLDDDHRGSGSDS
jgi:hypothetical protein